MSYPALSLLGPLGLLFSRHQTTSLLSFNFSILSDIFFLLSCMSSFFDMVESSGKENCASLSYRRRFSYL
jgi:hypothetical protein